MSLPDLFIETERLLIRPFTMADIEPAYQMNLDADVSRFTGDGGVVSRDEMERRIVEDVLGDYNRYGFGRLAVEWKGTNRFIGFTGLKYLEDLDEVDLGYRFMSAYWGKGIATESGRACVDLGFGQLGLNKLIAMVLPENTGSIRVLDKLDFTFAQEHMEDQQLVHVYSLVNPRATEIGSSV